jgi:hypothetical protein
MVELITSVFYIVLFLLKTHNFYIKATLNNGKAFD